MVTAPVSCANDEFRVANSEAPRIDARDQFAENFRCLCQGTRGVLDDGRPGCASVIIHHSICPATAHETIYQNSALASPTLHRPLMLAGRREEDFQGSIKSGRDHAESCMESRNESGTAGRLLPRMCSMRCAKNIEISLN